MTVSFTIAHALENFESLSVKRALRNLEESVLDQVGNFLVGRFFISYKLDANKLADEDQAILKEYLKADGMYARLYLSEDGKNLDISETKNQDYCNKEVSDELFKRVYEILTTHPTYIEFQAGLDNAIHVNGLTITFKDIAYKILDIEVELMISDRELMEKYIHIGDSNGDWLKD